ncbi:MAG: DNA repair protein RecN [Dehalococcoidales bacterium]|nr:DNA repair protein RecN [Dehalococcoidales bacterium]
MLKGNKGKFIRCFDASQADRRIMRLILAVSPTGHLRYNDAHRCGKVIDLSRIARKKSVKCRRAYKLLLELRVSNFGIIEQMIWQPGQGLNIITGETGAGKSLVVDALEALLSARDDETIIRYGSDTAFLEGRFDISGAKYYRRLHELLGENGLLESGGSELIISKEMRRRGRSALRVNGKAVPRGVLSRLGSLMVDIHGQSDHLSLLNRDFHLDFLDAYGHTTELRDEFATRAALLALRQQELKTINENEKERVRQGDFLRFQIDELKRADLKAGEEEALEKERSIQASSEKLKEASHEAYRALYGDDSTVSGASALDKLGAAAHAMQTIAALDDTLQPQLDYIRELESGLADIARDLRSYRDRIDYDPQRLEFIELRLGLIRDLKRKYGQSIAEINEYLKKAGERLAAFDTSGERRRQLETDILSLKKEMGDIAARLSRKRTDAARELMAAVNRELAELDMAQVEFAVSLERNEHEDGIPLPDGNSYAVTRDGIDIAEFRASTNPGEPVKPLAAIASTGEVSRFMLALKSALAEADSIPVLVFDEIDIGVGGRSGEIVGRKLWELGRHRQVVCITHLPQIAAFADYHYRVQKKSAGDRTTSAIEPIHGDDLVKEIALMLAGPQHTETALQSTRELMDKAMAWKGMNH